LSDFPLIKNNIDRDDLDLVIEYLKQDDPRLTNGPKIKEFEKSWSKWLGVKYSVFVNSGSSANLLTIAMLKIKYPQGGNIIVPAFTWVSDVASCLLNGFEPRFVDINLDTLALDTEKTINAIDENTKAVFLTHAQGFNGLTSELKNSLKEKNIILIEDVCESHGATFLDKKCGAHSWASNFSFYYAHHMTTIEGGMICTNDPELYQQARMLRSHGLLRESSDKDLISKTIENNPELNPEFIFKYLGYNMRGNEINAIIGLNQLKKLDNNIHLRNQNQKLFYDNLDSKKFKTDFNYEGSSNYAFNVILNDPDIELMRSLEKNLLQNSIEYRRGSAGGGNQLRQPYLSHMINEDVMQNLKNTDHVHFYGLYIGNYPSLSSDSISFIVNMINLS